MRNVLTLCVMILFGIFTKVQASHVSNVTAQKVAENFAKPMLQGKTITVIDMTDETSYTEFYVFRLLITDNDQQREGFVLVAGDDCVMPILGYSLNNRFVIEGMPANISSWMEGYQMQIRYYKDLESRMGRDGIEASWMHSCAPEWQRLSATNTTGSAGMQLSERATFTAVSPLLTTTWNQGQYYNDQCPYDYNESTHTYTGCTATATAQVMKYWNHPTTGYGSHSYLHDDYGTQSVYFGAATYNWNQMPNALTSSSSSTQVNAVATLMYHVGVAVEMDYGTDGSSGATMSSGNINKASAENALKSYFKYSPALHGVFIEDYTSEEWNQLLRNELNNNRPIIYTGFDTAGGHAFVLDGYDANGMFHINWGWGGWCDDYYVIGHLHPTSSATGTESSYNFDLNNSAIIGIQPNYSYSPTGTSTITVNSNSTSAGSVSGGGTKSFGDTVSLRATANTGYRFVQWNDGYKFNPRQFVATGGNLSFTAQFEALSGDTLGYCGNYHLTSFGNSTANSQKYWGIRLPASTLTAGHNLAQVQLYIYNAGEYELNIYVGGVSSSNLQYSQSYVFNDTKCWQTITLETPVTINGGQDVWITFRNEDVNYPATLTYNSGNSDAMLWGSNFGSLSSSWDYSFMIRGIFDHNETPVVVSGDTISYCGDLDYATSWRLGSNSTWGISFDPEDLSGRNYLRELLFYVINATDNFQISIYQGTATNPDTLIHSQQFNPGGITGWRSITMNSVVPIDTTRHLWVVFNYPTTSEYPVSACIYTGNSRSDWFYTNDTGEWVPFHTYGNDYQYSWLIKCVTSATETEPLPPVTINGSTLFYDYTPQTFSAISTATGTVNWTLPAATPSTATGNPVTAQWNNPGYHTLSASIATPQGTTTGFLQVGVQHYNSPNNDTVSYCHNLSFWGNWGYSSGSTWYGITLTPSILNGRDTLKAVQLYPIHEGLYTLHIYTGNDQLPGTEIYTQNINLSITDQWVTIPLTTPLTLSSQNHLWVIFESSASSYVGSVCDYAVEPLSNWISPNGTDWYHLGNAEGTHSWMIRCITKAYTEPVISDPSVSTLAATNATQTTAQLNATITNPDNVIITAKGFEWKETAGGSYTSVNGINSGNSFYYNLNNLTPNTSYTYKAFITFNGNTVYGNEMTFTTLEEVITCDAPTGLYTSNITHESITVNWDNNPDVLYWNLRYRPLNGMYTTGSSATNSYVISGLNPETTYEIQVQSNCDDGLMSEWTPAITATTTVAPVIDPTVTTGEATAVSENGATLNASITNPSNVTITTKGFEWKVTGSGSYTPVYVTGTDNTFQYNLSNLTPNTSYTYRAFITFNSNIIYGNEMTFTTLEETPCDVPTGLSASNVTSESITISWDDNPNVSNWNVRYRPLNGSYITESSNENFYTLSGLTPETTYEFQVQAVCGDDNLSNFSSTITAATTVGIESHLFNSINLYPNPTNDFVNVQCTMNNEQMNVMGIEVYDVYGKLITCRAAAMQQLYQINVSEWAKGMYFVRVTTEAGVVTKSFVKK